ncbi:DoxX family protein [Maribellus sp. YY47]|uniref:DoxX family protein n=1 Tax=Maribellus sp. YY47 TaxID=2929486 RepID=UPI002000EA0E|nr:DoxX family protein [Maribellus sp. YY47]MCK3684367.1 DoxX family protein [Maribellus sp. YY47]
MNNQYSNKQIIALTLLRVAIGWHFLYEGLFKYLSSGWSSASFLLHSTGPLAPLFKSWAQSQTMIENIDALNIWGLILIGLALFLGFFEKPAKFFGIVLLSFYYLAYPPFSNLAANFHTGGNYWIIDRNIIEIASLVVLMMFSSGTYTGLDRFVVDSKIKKDSIIYKLFFHRKKI